MPNFEFIIVNEIETDGDFSYSMHDDSVNFVVNDGEAYELMVKYMTSLTQASSHQSKTEEMIRQYAREWLESNNKIDWYIPNKDFGNQCIDFRMIDISGLEIDTKSDIAIVKKILAKVL